MSGTRTPWSRSLLIVSLWSFGAFILLFGGLGTFFLESTNLGDLAFYMVMISYALACFMFALRARRIRRADARLWESATESTREILIVGVLSGAALTIGNIFPETATAVENISQGTLILGAAPWMLYVGHALPAQLAAEGLQPTARMPRVVFVLLIVAVAANIGLFTIFLTGWKVETPFAIVTIEPSLFMAINFGALIVIGVYLAGSIFAVRNANNEALLELCAVPRQYLALDFGLLYLFSFLIIFMPLQANVFSAIADVASGILTGTIIYGVVGSFYTVWISEKTGTDGRGRHCLVDDTIEHQPRQRSNRPR